MIIDHINNAALYYGLGGRIRAGLRFLQTAELRNLPLGKNVISGDDLFAVVSEYKTKPEISVKWEAHRRYIDIQYIVSGMEIIGCQWLSKLKITVPYHKNNDVLFLRGAGNRLVVQEGFFVIFYPQDAHRPGLSVRRSRAVRKIVVKALVN